jgi:hypothetical protein
MMSFFLDLVRYTAPEVMENGKIFATAYSDTYSFAMLVLECITEKVPFSNVSEDTEVIRVSKKECPPRPDGKGGRNRVSDELWGLMKRCWSVEPDSRPTMKQVHSFFLGEWPVGWAPDASAPPLLLLPPPPHCGTGSLDVQALSGLNPSQAANKVQQMSGLTGWQRDRDALDETGIDRSTLGPTLGEPSTNGTISNTNRAGPLPTGGKEEYTPKGESHDVDTETPSLVDPMRPTVGSDDQTTSSRTHTAEQVTSNTTTPATQFPSPNIPHPMNPGQPTSTPGLSQDSGVTATQRASTDDYNEFIRAVLKYIDR